MSPSPKDKEREHETDMPYCWCNPRKIVYPNGNMAILHNYNQENNMKKIIKVTDEIYTDDQMGVLVNGEWKPATPEPYYPNIFERIQHWFVHYTFGQPYCVVCLKKKKSHGQ